MKALPILALLACTASAAPPEPAFMLAPYATANGSETAFGIQFRLKIGGIFPSRQEIAALSVRDGLSRGKRGRALDIAQFIQFGGEVNFFEVKDNKVRMETLGYCHR